MELLKTWTRIINELCDYAWDNNFKRLITLSPKTEMSRKFHLKNGAFVLVRTRSLITMSIYMKTIIHINKNLKQSNDKHGKSKPVCRVEVDGETWYSSTVDILGRTQVCSPDKPRKCELNFG